MVLHLHNRFGVSQRRACKLTGQPRSTQRTLKTTKDLDVEISEVLKLYGKDNPRRGYKKAFRHLLDQGYAVNIKRVHRLWREAGLKVPYKRKKKPSSRVGSEMGTHQPLYQNVTWAMDFQFDETEDGRIIKILNVIDEYSREALASFADRSIKAVAVIGVLDVIMAIRGAPRYIRCDNDPEFIANDLKQWCDDAGITLYHTDPGSPWQNGRCESFNSRLRDEVLNGELFNNLVEARILLQEFLKDYNLYRPHSSLGYLSPTEFLTLLIPEQRLILTNSTRRKGWMAKGYLQASRQQNLQLVS